MIVVKDVSKVFLNQTKEIQILNNVSFVVEENQFVSIVGPSGCGKTTLLKIMGGLLASFHGKSLIEGIDSTEYLLHRDIGFVFQSPNLMRWRTAVETIGRTSYLDPSTGSVCRVENRPYNRSDLWRFASSIAHSDAL